MAAKVLLLAIALFCAASAAPESRDTRIVGGEPLNIQDFPYVAALVYFYPGPELYIQRCTGAIVSSYHVISTAFCFFNADLANFLVRAGSTYSLTGGSTVRIIRYEAHPDYSADPRLNDIAVVFLGAPLGISTTINSLYLPPTGYSIPDGTSVKVVSWGFVSAEGPQLDTLQSVTLDTVPLEQCKASFEEVETVTIDDPVLCAANDAGEGTCSGDSGAPAAIDNVLVGIASVFHECGTETYPDVFTRIDRFTTWIMETATPPVSVRSSTGFDSPRIAY